MYILTIPQHFANLRKLSSTVEEYLSQQMYIADFGNDEYNERDILAQCYEIAEMDLNGYGVYLDWQYKGDFYRSGYVQLLLEFIISLRTLITNDNQDTIIAALNESDNTIKDLFAVFEHDKHFQPLNYLIDHCYSTDTFDQYIQSILHSLEDDSAIYDPDIDREVKYIEKTRELRAYATKYTNIILSNMQKPYEQPVIDKLLKEYDLDKINPSQIKIYSRIDLDEVPEGLKEFKERQMLIHHERSKHHIEYWIDPNKSPRPLLTYENMVLLVAHHAEPGTTKPEFSDSIEHMIDMGRTIFTEQQIALIRQMAQIVLENME